MKTILQKLIQDLWIFKSKLFLSIIATAVAAWGVVAVCFTFLFSERDFKTNYEGANPSDFTFVIESLNDSIVTILNNEPSLVSWERRELLKGHIENKNGVWMPLLLFGVESLERQKLDKIDIKRIMNNGSFFIEQNAVGFINDLNGNIDISLGKDKKQLRYNPAGLIHDPLQAPAQMEQVFYAYASLSSIDSLLMENTTRLIFQASRENRDYVSLKHVAEDLSVKLMAMGAKITELDIREPGKHVHQPIIDGVSFLQICFGSVLLLLGSTLFAMILLMWLIPQIPTIGIMKSLGATRQEIYKAYVVIILLIASIGLLIGFPTGLMTASKFSGFIAMVQNFEPVSGYFPVQYYILVALFSLLPPLVIGLIPIHQISAAPVRQALATVFYKESVTIIRLLSKSRLNAQLKYSINNIFRNGFRTYLLLLLLCLGLCLYFTGSILSNSFSIDLAEYFNGTPYQITINLPEATNGDFGFLHEVNDVQAVVPILQTNISYQHRAKEHQAFLTVYPDNYQIKEGMFLKGAENRNISDCIFIHPQMSNEEFKDVKLGEEVILFFNDSTKQKFKYGGVIRDVFPGRKAMMFLFTHSGLSQFSKLSIKLKDKDRIKNSLKEIESTLQQRTIKYRSITDVDTSKAMLINHFKPTYLIIQALGLFTFLISLMGMLIVVRLTLKERISEMGIIKALGGSVRWISKLYVTEFLSLTLVSVAIALLLAQILSSILCQVYGDMIRGFNIAKETNYLMIVTFIVLVMLIQSTAIFLFSKLKIKETSLDLLNNTE
jgi:ABC-type antimicrobial peptide transport system permease subunit